MRWCLPWQDKVAVLQILKTVLRGIWRPSYILITRFSQPEESTGGKTCGKVTLSHLKTGDIAENNVLKQEGRERMCALFLILSSLVGICILIRSTSALHMLSLPLLPVGLGSTSADPNSLQLPSSWGWAPTWPVCVRLGWGVGLHLPASTQSGECLQKGKQGQNVLWRSCEWCLKLCWGRDLAYWFSNTAEPCMKGRDLLASLWSEILLQPVFKGGGVEIWLQAVRLQPACQTALCRNTIHVDFTEKVVIHISPLIYCFLTSSLWWAFFFPLKKKKSSFCTLQAESLVDPCPICPPSAAVTQAAHAIASMAIGFVKSAARACLVQGCEGWNVPAGLFCHRKRWAWWVGFDETPQNYIGQTRPLASICRIH